MHHHNLIFAITLPFVLSSVSHAQESLFPQLDSESANAIGGNWKVVLKDGKGAIEYEGHLVMTPPLKTGEVVLKGGAMHSLLMSNSEEKWKSHYLDDNIFDQDIKIAGSKMKFAHAHGIGGHWGCVSVIDFSGDTGKGKWNYRANHRGTETWTRLRAKISKVEFGPLKAGEEGSLDEKPASTVPYGQNTNVPGVYSEKSWGPENNFPHARPKFYIRVYGDNLWGFHVASIPDAAGFEVTRNLPIYSDGKSDYKGQIGQTYIVSLSPEITNGPKVFRLDDLEVPFDINVKGLKPVKSKE